MERDKIIDEIKGMGIFCMVAGHCAFPFTEFIYLFHMAIFFIASGYCYKQSNSDSIASVTRFIKRKLKSLWGPYVLWSVIYSLCHNFFIKINVYTNNPLYTKYVPEGSIAMAERWDLSDMAKNIMKAFLLQGNTQMGGAFWFIATLMEVSICFCIMDFFIKFFNKKPLFIQGGFAIALHILGFICSLNGYFLMGLEKVFSYYILFYAGYLIKVKNFSGRKRGEVLHIVNLAFCFSALLILKKFGNISLHLNAYVNPFYLLATSIMGWQFLYELAFLLQKLPFLTKILVCMGKNTMAVVILHFLCFKIVNYIGVLYEDKPLFLVAAFPYLYSGSLWWVAYLTAGLVIPICLNLLWKKAKNKYHLSF